MNQKAAVEGNPLAIKSQPVKFQKFYVTNGTLKARCSYHCNNHVSGKPCVTIYAKDYDRRALGRIIPQGYENNTDSQSDYFEAGLVRLFEDHPLYAAALARAESNDIDRMVKQAHVAASWA